MLVVLIMEMKIEKINTTYQTADMACAAALSLFFPIDAVDRSGGRRVFFLFKHSPELDEFLEQFWKGEIQVEPRAYFDSIKAIKTRLYDQIWAMLAPDTLKELDVILREEFGAELISVEVFEVGTALVSLFDSLQEMDWKDKQGEEFEKIDKNEHEKVELHKTV